VLGALDFFSVWSGDVGSFRSVLSFNYVEYNFLTVSKRCNSLFRIELGNGALMYKDVFASNVVPRDKAVSVDNIEPLHDSSDSLLDHLLRLLTIFGWRAGLLAFGSFWFWFSIFCRLGRFPALLFFWGAFLLISLCVGHFGP